MKPKCTLVLVAASLLGAVSQSASAQVACAQTIGISVEQSQLIVEGWSVKKSFLGKSVYNDNGEKIGGAARHHHCTE